MVAEVVEKKVRLEQQEQLVLVTIMRILTRDYPVVDVLDVVEMNELIVLIKEDVIVVKEDVVLVFTVPPAVEPYLSLYQEHQEEKVVMVD
jgi:dihydrodipicolinate reductase